MTVQNPLFMDINNVYSGDELGLPYRDIMGEGIVGATDLAVTAGTGNTVNVAAGACWVVGDTDTVHQPTYRVLNDAVVNLGISPDATNPRYVLVGMQVNDAGFTGATRNGTLTAIHGTPAGSPAVPATPASFLPLAQVLVPANAASSAAYTITDLRARSKVGGGQAQSAGSVQLLCDQLLGAPQASFDTNTLLGGNIPQTYRHLKGYMDLRGTNASNNVQALVTFNNDSTAGNYGRLVDWWNGTGNTFSGTAAAPNNDIGATSIPAASLGAGYSSAIEFEIINYTGTAFFRKMLFQGYMYDGTSQYNMRGSLIYAPGAVPITRMAVAPNSGNWATGCRFTLYGMA